jgi:ATP-dependent protease HslVU (ClpYQ) peptidase subunit
MTTILAYRNVMVADSRVSECGVAYRTRKLYSIGKMIVGCSGCSIYINEFVRQLREFDGDFSQLKAPKGIEAEDDEGDPEFAALVLDESGLYVFGIDFVPDRVDGLYHAIGSGRKAALGALEVMRRLPVISVNPITAVEVACEVDIFSGGPVHFMSLDDEQREIHCHPLAPNAPQDGVRH